MGQMEHLCRPDLATGCQLVTFALELGRTVELNGSAWSAPTAWGGGPTSLVWFSQGPQ